MKMKSRRLPRVLIGATLLLLQIHTNLSQSSAQGVDFRQFRERPALHQSHSRRGNQRHQTRIARPMPDTLRKRIGEAVPDATPIGDLFPQRQQTRISESEIMQKRMGQPQRLRDRMSEPPKQSRVIQDWESYKVKRIRNKPVPTKVSVLPPIRRNEESKTAYYPIEQSEDAARFVPTALPRETTPRPTLWTTPKPTWTTRSRVTSVYFPSQVNVATTPIPPWAQTHPAPTPTTTSPRYICRPNV